jgi:hypothetical protein
MGASHLRVYALSAGQRDVLDTALAGLSPGNFGQPVRAEAVSTPCRQFEGRVALPSLDVHLGLRLGHDLGGVCDHPHPRSPGSLAPVVTKGYFGCCVDRGITLVSYE